MDKNKLWHNEVTGEKVVAALERNNFTAYYAACKGVAIAHILEQIDTDATIGIGGSMTTVALGLDSRLKEQGHTIYNHNIAGLSKEESLAVRHKELLADIFITSTNAVTLDGQLVNTDGAGNRVAAMIFGPKKVIVIAGINKIVADVSAAKRRIEQIAAPVNAKRLHKNTPCTVSGSCADCSSPERICAVTTILHKKPIATAIHVVIIGEELGY